MKAKQTNADSATSLVIERVRSLVDGAHSQDASRVARQTIKDWIGVALAGRAEPLTQILIDTLREDESVGPATIVGLKQRAPLRLAALVNGAMGHAIDYDDTYTPISCHITAGVLPAILAASEASNFSGPQFLRTFVAAYEAVVMIGKFIGLGPYENGFHNTGLLDGLGAATAIAVSTGLDDGTAARALSIAATQAAGLRGQFGTMCKPLHAGKAGESALLAVQLAKRGFTAHEDVLEGANCFAAAHQGTFDLEALRASPPKGEYIVDNQFKHHAACHGVHPSIEAVLAMRGAGLSPEDVASVTLRLNPAVHGICDDPAPRSGLQAKFSVQLAVAMAMLGHDTTSPGSFSDEMVRDLQLKEFSSRIKVTLDETVPRMAAEVIVTRTDGIVERRTHDLTNAASDLIAQGLAVDSKFTCLVGRALGADAVHRLGVAIDGLDSTTTVRQLTAVLRGDLHVTRKKAMSNA